MKSISPNYLKSIALSIDDVKIIKKIGEFKGRQQLFIKQTPEILVSLKKVAVIESNESSNRLEGIEAPKDRIEALIKETTSPQTRSEQEIAGYRDALNLIHEVNTEMEFTENLILQLHSMINRYAPNESGRWKSRDNEIVERDGSGKITKVRFKPVNAIKTPDSMRELVNGYVETIYDKNHEPLVIIPLVILDFLCIHPFLDGNGRVSRLLTLMLLYRFGYEVGRYISLERIFEESKESYYETLEKSSERWHQAEHNCYHWLRYFWGVIYRAYSEFEEKVGEVKVTQGTKTEYIKNIIKKRLTPFSISDIESACPGISRDMIRLVLRQLKSDGVIELQGKGRNAKWKYRGESK